ncbi:hypothetical protein MKX01_005119, partial [Papaver californicum]
RAGVSYRAKGIGESIYGASGLFNIWTPSVTQDQSSSTEIALQSGFPEELNYVNRELYGDIITRSFAYWTGDGGKNTGCYNTLCSGFFQVHDKYTLDIPITRHQYFDLQLGRCYLTLNDNNQIGYWPIELFSAFAPGATYIYWGGRVKAGKNGITPPMGSAGFFQHHNYIDANNQPLQPEQIEYTVECHEHYDARYYPNDNILHFGGYGGGHCTSS